MKKTALIVTLAIGLLGGCGSSNSSSTASTTSTTAPTSHTTSSTGSIPRSAAVDALTTDLTTPVAADLVAKCKALVTAFEADGRGAAHAAAVLAALTRLAEVVRSIDPAVADALRGHPGGTVHWCKVKGFASS